MITGVALYTGITQSKVKYTGMRQVFMRDRSHRLSQRSHKKPADTYSLPAIIVNLILLQASRQVFDS